MSLVHIHTFALAILLLPLNVLAALQHAPANRPSLSEANEPTRIIIQRRDTSTTLETLTSELHRSAPQLKKLSRGSANRTEVWTSDTALDEQTKQRILGSLQSRRDVEFASISRRRHPHAIPSDVLFNNQWYLQTAQPAAIDATGAWDLTLGDATVIVAVLDSGVRFDHPDLAGKLLPGYDFVSGESNGGFLTANDGDGWDSDASDPGDWIDSADKAKSIFRNCDIENSSWHGTRVSGMIGVNTDNAIGIAGAGWHTTILPVRVLGKCGGFDDDIIAGMKWAAGLHVSDSVPDNPNPAKIINLSLGGSGICGTLYKSTIQQLNAMGVVVVVSAGNEGGPVDEPANCPGAIGVAGLRQLGTKVGYSSLGPEISIAAPAGNCFNTSGACLYSLDTTYNTGPTVPATSSYTDQFNTNLGTSFSAPLASGVAALMRAVNTQLTASQLRTRMMEGATTFPTPAGVTACHVPMNSTDIQGSECTCTTATCGAGMLNARNAVIAAQRPILNLTLPTTIIAGRNFALDASGSTASVNRTIASYAWTLVTACNVAEPSLQMTNQSSLTAAAPTTGSYTLRLVVTDSQGAVDSTDVTVTPSTTGIGSAPTCIAPPPAPPTPMPAAASSSSSGGGNVTLSFLTVLSIFCALATQRPARNQRRIGARV